MCLIDGTWEAKQEQRIYCTRELLPATTDPTTGDSVADASVAVDIAYIDDIEWYHAGSLGQ